MQSKMANDVHFQSKMTQLRDEYLRKLPGEIISINHLVQSLTANESDRDKFQDIQQRLHKLSGSGGTFGLVKLSKLAKKLDQQLQTWINISPLKIKTNDFREFKLKINGLCCSLDKLRPNILSPESNVKPITQSENVCLWIIDSNKENSAELMHQLKPFSYQVHIFHDPDEASKVAASEKPDLLLINIEYGMDPDAEQYPNSYYQIWGLGCPTIVLSNDDNFTNRALAAQHSADGFFPKPLNVPKLVNRLVRLLEKSQGKPMRVLIVDDDATLASYYRLVLLSAGIQAELLKTPEEIIEKVARFRPELVLMDIYMPRYSGPNLASIIRQHENWAGLPVVYLSAETNLQMQAQALRSGADGFLTKPISEEQLVAAVRSQIERAREIDAQINRDSLTGMLKHASIKEVVDLEVKHALRLGTPVTLAMLDIDHFKLVNDTYGHAAGDIVISSVAMLLQQRLRQSDITGRYGGEEFVAVLPQCDGNDAQLILDDIRERFSQIRFSHNENEFTCTLSIGYATITQHPDSTGKNLLIAADKGLYKAKNNGRNCIVPYIS